MSQPSRWVVEFVGEKHGFQLAGLPDLAVPLRTIALVIGAIEQLADILGRDPIVGKTMKRPRDLQQPGILDGRIDAIEVSGEILDASRRVEVGRDQLGGHSGRMGELGVVVISQDLIEMARGRPARIDVGVRVVDRPARHLVEEFAGR